MNRLTENLSFSSSVAEDFVLGCVSW